MIVSVFSNKGYVVQLLGMFCELEVYTTLNKSSVEICIVGSYCPFLDTPTFSASYADKKPKTS